jgi:hypothetical protein
MRKLFNTFVRLLLAKSIEVKLAEERKAAK